ncbi:hypothetical protein QUF75_20650 [Desulfococcaceae bacterium HSG7]|nr:hypothetical protein [Desulfococcaceae bacterium HSG7]
MGWTLLAVGVIGMAVMMNAYGSEGARFFSLLIGFTIPVINVLAITTRHVLNAVITRQADGYIIFEIEGVGFLKHMVRNIVGTIADVGSERLTPDDVRAIRLSKDRKQAGLNAPAYGLFLVKIKYTREGHNL